MKLRVLAAVVLQLFMGAEILDAKEMDQSLASRDGTKYAKQFRYLGSFVSVDSQKQLDAADRYQTLLMDSFVDWGPEFLADGSKDQKWQFLYDQYLSALDEVKTEYALKHLLNKAKEHRKTLILASILNHVRQHYSPYSSERFGRPLCDCVEDIFDLIRDKRLCEETFKKKWLTKEGLAQYKNPKFGADMYPELIIEHDEGVLGAMWLLQLYRAVAGYHVRMGGCLSDKSAICEKAASELRYKLQQADEVVERLKGKIEGDLEELPEINEVFQPAEASCDDIWAARVAQSSFLSPMGSIQTFLDMNKDVMSEEALRNKQKMYHTLNRVKGDRVAITTLLVKAKKQRGVLDGALGLWEGKLSTVLGVSSYMSCPEDAYKIITKNASAITFDEFLAKWITQDDPEALQAKTVYQTVEALNRLGISRNTPNMGHRDTTARMAAADEHIAKLERMAINAGIDVNNLPKDVKYLD